MRLYKWNIHGCDLTACEELYRSGIPALLSAVLCSRGCETSEKAEALFSASTDGLHPPEQLKGLTAALERIRLAISRGEHIAIYGDYDVDGITSTALMTSALTRLGAQVEAYIPNRIDEGYGLNSAAVGQLRERGASLLITVDCGITAVGETTYANGLGMDVIITDHHECQGEIPDAAAVINPKQPDCPYPNKQLAGVGVAFKLVCALLDDAELATELYGDLVAVGTIADVMPVTGENRILIKQGIRQLRRMRRPGFSALMSASGIDAKSLGTTTISYILAPRINAAGRMGEASTALELLLCGAPERAGELAGELIGLNRMRQQREMEMFEQAVDMLGPGAVTAPIVLASPDWHQGVAGIVASKLAERYCCPAIVICAEGNAGRGSCRSFGGFNLFAALENVSGTLLNFGGHEFAAGLTIDCSKIDEFRRRLAEYYKENCSDANLRAPSLDIDLELTSAKLLTVGEIDALDRLEPYGNGNERPLVCLRGAKLKQISSMGEGKHTRARISLDGMSLDCVCFSRTPDDYAVSAGDTVDLAFYPQVNEYRGSRTVQLLLADLRPDTAELSDETEGAGLFDRLISGGNMDSALLASLCPERESFVEVWRGLTSRGARLRGSRAAVLRSVRGGVGPAAALVCMEVFRELGLISGDLGSDIVEITVNTPKIKANLEDSALLASLRRAASDQCQTREQTPRGLRPERESYEVSGLSRLRGSENLYSQ